MLRACTQRAKRLLLSPSTTTKTKKTKKTKKQNEQQANQIVGLQPGEVFVQRNVGNQAMHTDMNLMACLEYAVKALKVSCVGCFFWLCVWLVCALCV